MTSIAAAALGATALGAYLDAKYHVKKDLNLITRMRSAEKDLAVAIAQKNLSLWTKFEEQVNKFPPDHRCIWTREASYSWRQVHDWALKYASLFSSLGVARPELVAFYLQNSDHFAFAQIGTWAVSTAPAMINYNLGGEGLIHCLKVARTRVILVDEAPEVRQRIEEVRDRLEGELGMKIIVLDDRMKAEIAALEPKPPSKSVRETVKATDPSMLSESAPFFARNMRVRIDLLTRDVDEVYTSGTTGLPKACPFPVMRTWLNGGNGRVDHLGLQSGPNGSTWYDPMPLYHGTGNHVMCLCLLGGVQLAIGKKFKVSSFWDDVRDSDANAFVYVGETARYLLAAPPSPRDKDHKVVVIFGNGLRPDVWERFQDRFAIERICEFFNSTEGVFGLVNLSRGPFFARAVGHHGGIMRFMLRKMYVPVEVSSEDGSITRDPKTGFARRVTYNEGGEIIVKVPNEQAFVGYLNAPEATQKKFARDVFEKGDLYYRSGDSLRRDDDGRWFFLDRLGDTFRWKSENVSTAEVAIAIGEFPGVVEANVYGVLVPANDGRAGCAALNLEPSVRNNFDYAKLHKHLRQRLPKYAVPIFLRLVDDQAHTSHNQKQNKVPLRKEGVDFKAIKEGSGAHDEFYWLKPGSNAYVPYSESDWEALVAGTAKL